ncbi:SAC3/GANP/Nin1/mts3/eIF-3 p25 family-domain-containing protein [Spinellus fusiger]|nr:SAC3/GANP/Nin1/mts3/eIF-3 p25 family-domain-containing protein [Spinellus fusiger]
MDWDKHTIIGTCAKLEKQYLRLTSAPDPSTVRPLAILKKTLDLLKNKWRTEQNYTYICDQFKSMRQDLTVQRIRNEFTVQVYEIHARIALEKGDLGEYNQCQSQLKQLYVNGISGNVMEFTAYRILYLLHTQNWSDINSTMAEVTPEQKRDEAVQHALQVRSSMATSNYHRFFRLYLSAPNMGGYLMDQFIERERVNALIVLCKACRPDITLSFVQMELAFENLGQLSKFLVSQKAHYLKAENSGLLDTKAACQALLESAKVYKKIDIKGQM